MKKRPVGSLACLALLVAGSSSGQEVVTPVGPSSASAGNRTTELVHAQSLTPYVGVTTDGTVIEGLYSIDPAWVEPTSDLVQAAKDFLGALTQEQRAKATYPIDDPEWRRWSNTSSYIREGLGFDEMMEGQR